VEYYDENGVALVDPEDIYELRIVRTGGTNYSGWKQLFTNIISKLPYGNIYVERQGDLDYEYVWLDPEIQSDTYIQNTSSMSFHYIDQYGRETFDPTDVLTAIYEAIDEYEGTTGSNTQTINLSLFKATENHYSDVNSGVYGYSGGDLSNGGVTGTTFTISAILNELYEWNGTLSQYGFCEIKAVFRKSDSTLVTVSLTPKDNSYVWTASESLVTSFTVSNSNYRNAYVSFNNEVGRYKFECSYNSTFWNTNH